jgi:hypothetical protein
MASFQNLSQRDVTYFVTFVVEKPSATHCNSAT